MNARFWIVIVQLALLSRSVLADPVIPGNILNPQTAPEAWNAIRLATSNVERLISEKRFTEITVQLGYCSPALRELARLVTKPEDIALVKPETDRAIGWLSAVARAANENNAAGTAEAYAKLRLVLDGIAQHFDPKAVKADIYFCPMHPDFSSEDAKTPCAKCGMNLLTRRIPYSFVYMKPGEPSLRMTASASAPVEAGKKIEVKIKLAKGDNAPLLLDDLMVMHSQPIHLLIEEPGLGDYHHEHPVPTETPGEYVFSYTPAKTAPYRIWADLVPTVTGVQELPHVDLPSVGQAGPVTNKVNQFSSTVGGYHFELTLANGNHIAAKAQQMRGMNIMVTDAQGQPVKQLEPVMNAFAHLVGFYDDYQTVVHLHPTGGDVLSNELRGGPVMGFKFFPPRAGFIRLYCQVSIGGQMLFAPFNVNVEP